MPRNLHTKFQLNRAGSSREDVENAKIMEIQDGHHGYHMVNPIKISWTILVGIVVRSIHTKFQLNRASSFRAGVKNINSKWRPWRPCLLSDQNFVSKFGSPHAKEPSHKISVELAKRFLRRCRKCGLFTAAGRPNHAISSSELCSDELKISAEWPK